MPGLAAGLNGVTTLYLGSSTGAPSSGVAAATWRNILRSTGRVYNPSSRRVKWGFTYTPFYFALFFYIIEPNTHVFRTRGFIERKRFILCGRFVEQQL